MKHLILYDDNMLDMKHSRSWDQQLQIDFRCFCLHLLPRQEHGHIHSCN